MAYRYVEAPDELYSIWFEQQPVIFLAGGITGCPDWQAVMSVLLADADVVVLNPRRADFPIHDPKAAVAQIVWEHRHLRAADRILFWFPKETLCPIVLYELGAWSMTDKPIAVGIEPGYAREADVRIQTQLARPDAPIVTSLADLAEAILEVGT